ncbi:SEC-C motif-containing protein [Pseudobutyrivibrio sp. C4]|uniref:YecA family protein n=1 Tax=Pseudobutyrivibrio sp. C4 TaxID=1520803 RepID=UPI0008BA1CA1|nr:SEC-C metal-binding domain-containing protein [Pseudobutyrivibrio sp. C4]SES64848.1 SEC-C motif-containing protein [Pseudobutyrivibrio sp. C4]
MQANLYYQCNVCNSICDLKYQYGFSKKHPIRYKCKCGVTISGEYSEENGIKFENATKTDNTNAQFVVNVSGEFLTPSSYEISSMEDSFKPTTFITAIAQMDYEKYTKAFHTILANRDIKYPRIRIINELHEANNESLLKEKIKEYFDPQGIKFPLNNKADILRAITMINQFQFLGCSNITQKTTDLFVQANREHPDEVNKYIRFLSSLNRIKEWKHRINTVCGQFYQKVDLLMPAISIDYYYDKSILDSNDYAITTTSFEDIKQLYVDFYELIASLLVVPLGLDNILIRGDYTKINNTVEDLQSVKTLKDVSEMRKKGNIIRLINTNEPLQSLLCTCLDAEVRNSIGHFSYHSEEISGSHNQAIRFINEYSSDEDIELSLIKICYNIWCMYNCLALFNELIHHIELLLLTINEGIAPSFIGNPALTKKMMGITKTKIYPNDPCPCGSGLKYKKCCKNRI